EQKWTRDLNYLYRAEPALHEVDFSAEGFEWIDTQDWENSILSFMRKGMEGRGPILVLCNFTPVPRSNYRVGVPTGGFWKELLNSDAAVYGGSGHGNMGGVEASATGAHGRPFSLELMLPPLSVVFLKQTGGVT
ncbi:MAG TPA: alpha amylase C-terminal domain-containing protein, partial [Bacteroidota bacterium]